MSLQSGGDYYSLLSFDSPGGPSLTSLPPASRLRFVVVSDAYRSFPIFSEASGLSIDRLRFSLMSPEMNFNEAQENLKEGGASLPSLWTPCEAGQARARELEYLEARLAANTDERDGITEKMSELYQSDRFAEMEYLNGCLRSSLDEMYDIRDRIEAITSLCERASAIDNYCPCDDSTSVTAAPEKASAIDENVLGELSCDICNNSTAATLTPENVAVAAPKAPELSPMIAVGCASLRFAPFVGQDLPSLTDRCLRSFLCVEELIPRLLRLRICARIRLLYYSLKMSRIKGSESDIRRMNWNFLSAFC